VLRRDLLATLLALLPASAVQSVADDLADGIGTELDGGDLDDGTAPDESGPRTAVVDRIEDGTAVLLFEDGTGQKAVSADVLPAAAREAGMVLRVPRGDSLALATVDRAATARRRRNASDRFDELAEPAPDAETATNATDT